MADAIEMDDMNPAGAGAAGGEAVAGAVAGAAGGEAVAAAAEGEAGNPIPGEAQNESFGTDPPSKILSIVDMIAIIAFYVGIDVGVSTLLFIKNVKNNWPYYKCQTNYMLLAGFFGYDTATNFQQCMQNMQSGYMTVLMEPANYLMTLTTSSIGGLTSSLNDVRDFMNNFRTNVSGGIANIFGVFLNLLVQIQRMIINLKDMVSKNVGIMTTSMYTMDTGMQAMKSTWAGPIGEVVRAL
jgi:hypothetical protein